MLLEQCSVLSTLLPEEGQVQQEENVAHDGSSREWSAVEESVEADNVDGEWQEQKSCQGCTLCPKTDDDNQEDDRLDNHDVAALHEKIDELKGL